MSYFTDTDDRGFYSDADIEMAEMAEQGNMIAAGVCPICEDALDPLAPKWAKTKWPRTRHLDGTYSENTAEDMARIVGPHGGVVDGYHDACARDAWGLA